MFQYNYHHCSTRIKDLIHRQLNNIKLHTQEANTYLLNKLMSDHYRSINNINSYIDQDISITNLANQFHVALDIHTQLIIAIQQEKLNTLLTFVNNYESIMLTNRSNPLLPISSPNFPEEVTYENIRQFYIQSVNNRYSVAVDVNNYFNMSSTYVLIIYQAVTVNDKTDLSIVTNDINRFDQKMKVFTDVCRPGVSIETIKRYLRDHSRSEESGIVSDHDTLPRGTSSFNFITNQNFSIDSVRCDLHDIVNFRLNQRTVQGLVIGFKFKDSLFEKWEDVKKAIEGKSNVCEYVVIPLVGIDSNYTKDIQQGKVQYIKSINNSVTNRLLSPNSWYELLSNSGQIQVKLLDDVTKSVEAMGLGSIRKTIQLKQTGGVVFKYKRFNKKTKGKNEEQVIHSALFHHSPANKDFKFLIEDIRFLFPSIKGFILPKDKSLKVGAIVTVNMNDGVKNIDQYIVKNITRYKNSRPLKSNKDIHSLDVVTIENNRELTKIEAKNLKVV